VLSVFAGDEVGLFEHTQRPKRDVFEIAYRRRDDEEGTRHLEAATKAESNLKQYSVPVSPDEERKRD